MGFLNFFNKTKDFLGNAFQFGKKALGSVNGFGKKINKVMNNKHMQGLLGSINPNLQKGANKLLSGFNNNVYSKTKNLAKMGSQAQNIWNKVNGYSNAPVFNNKNKPAPTIERTSKRLISDPQDTMMGNLYDDSGSGGEPDTGGTRAGLVLN